MEYPNFDHPIEHKRWWATNLNIKTTVDGLILPETSKDKLDSKIAINIEGASTRLQKARSMGKYCIYLPGSYDLTHIGHLSFICQCTDHCLKTIRQTNPNVERDDLYILAMVDSDNLVGHNKLFKHISHGGEETFFRPVERGIDEFGRYPRLDAVASLPVDAVGFLPAPTDPDLPLPVSIEAEAAITTIKMGKANLMANEAILKAIQNYQQLNDLIAVQHPDFPDWWSIELWQLYLTLTLTKTQCGASLPQPLEPGGITRLISADDFKYYDQVRFIGNVAGIAIEKLEDIHAHSSTRLLQDHLPEDLLTRKRIARLQKQ